VAVLELTVSFLFYVVVSGANVHLIPANNGIHASGDRIAQAVAATGPKTVSLVLVMAIHPFSG
jgi:hypothetical protein